MPEYLYNGKAIDGERIAKAASNLGLSVEDYTSRYGMVIADTGDEYNVKNGLWDIGKEYYESFMTGWETGRTNEENLEVFKGSTSFEDIEAMIPIVEQEKADAAAKKATDKASADAKLKALGLTDDEIAAL